jgi:hypothetical protein
MLDHAILQGGSMKHLDMMMPALPSPQLNLHGQQKNRLQPGASVHNLSLFTGSVTFSDAAWKPDPRQQLAPAGLEVFIQNVGILHCRGIHFAANFPTSIFSASS